MPELSSSPNIFEIVRSRYWTILLKWINLVRPSLIFFWLAWNGTMSTKTKVWKTTNWGKKTPIFFRQRKLWVFEETTIFFVLRFTHSRHFFEDSLCMYHQRGFDKIRETNKIGRSGVVSFGPGISLWLWRGFTRISLYFSIQHNFES